MDWSTYRSSTWDELIADGAPRPELGPLADYLAALTVSDVRARQRAAEAAVQAMGITFTVYQDGANLDRAWPLDVLPRVITTQEWDRVEAGLLQRMRALNLFIDDLYGAQKVIADGVLPAELLADSANFRPECCGISPPQGVWAHISGCDLVRDGDGT
ncbi:MAG: circularly permuted type 2 ATP-grasp protein, partial [Acidimicrobiales bacterium]|nr:circularly permuted type 2 ATP-grasp protein [Acidimicrobiales bacterium]